MNTEMQIKEIDTEIAQLENELANVKGTSTEVYSRIVGYYRAVGNWNKGKREEFRHRVCFNVSQKEGSVETECLENSIAAEIKADVLPVVSSTVMSAEKMRYILFSSQFCRNCQPVKDYLDNSHISYESVDVSTDLGLNAARNWSVKVTPTVIVLNNDKVVCEAKTREEVMHFFEGMKVAQ